MIDNRVRTARARYALRPREVDALEAIINHGPKNAAKTLARILGLSTNTTKTHLGRLYMRLGVHSAVAAFRLTRGLEPTLP